MNDTVWCIVIRQHDGTYIRETQDDFPELGEIHYWEKFYKIGVTNPSRPYYDNVEYHDAVVVNVFKVGDN